MIYNNQLASLPPPLTSEEEYELLQKIKDGDYTARQALVERNLRLAVFILRKFDNTALEFDDLFAIACLGLIKAANTFDINKNIKFATYASRCMVNQILMHLRVVRRDAETISLDDAISYDNDGNELHISDLYGTNDTYQFEETAELREIYEVLDKTCSKTERTVIKFRFGDQEHDPVTQKDVAQLLEISQSYVSRIEKKAIGKLRKKIGALEHFTIHPRTKNKDKIKKIGGNQEMSKIDKTQLVALCSEYGFTDEAYGKIAGLFDCSPATIKNYVYTQHIKDEVKGANNDVVVTKLSERPDLQRYVDKKPEDKDKVTVRESSIPTTGTTNRLEALIPSKKIDTVHTNIPVEPAALMCSPDGQKDFIYVGSPTYIEPAQQNATESIPDTQQTPAEDSAKIITSGTIDFEERYKQAFFGGKSEAHTETTQAEDAPIDKPAMQECYAGLPSRLIATGFKSARRSFQWNNAGVVTVASSDSECERIILRDDTDILNLIDELQELRSYLLHISNE